MFSVLCFWWWLPCGCHTRHSAHGNRFCSSFHSLNFRFNWKTVYLFSLQWWDNHNKRETRYSLCYFCLFSYIKAAIMFRCHEVFLMDKNECIGHCLFRLKFATTQNEFTIQTIDLNFKFQIAHLFLSLSQSLCSSGSCSWFWSDCERWR